MADNIDNQGPSMALIIRQAFKNLMKEVHTSIPGYIVSFDPATQTAEVQAGIRRIFIKRGADSEEKEAIDIPKFINVPVVFPRAGGWAITFPVKADDECLIHFSERAIDVWHKNGKIQDPKDWRMHSFSDAICELGLSSAPNAITNFDDENFQIRNEEGDTNITLLPDKTIQVNTPFKVIAAAPVVEIKAETSVLIDTPNATFTGDVNIQGNQTIDGTSQAADHISDGISGKDHVHKIKSGSSAPGPTDKPE